MAQGDESSVSPDPTAGLKGDELLDALKADHWFWHWGDTTAAEESRVPESMVDPDGFMNFETGMIKSFLEELQQDGIELTPTPDDSERPLIDRVKFMEWLILRYLKDTPEYSREDIEAYAAEKVAEAKSSLEAEAEESVAGLSRDLERAEMEAEAARSGWIRLDTSSEQTGIDSAELFRTFGDHYSLGLVNGGTSWAARWFDAFDWLQEHYATQWDPEADGARKAIADLVDRGISESAARDKVRRQFINESAALPVNKKVGIHTLADTRHLFEGHSIIGFDAEGETIASGYASGWDPYTAKEAEWGFPIRGEGPNY